MAFTTVVSGVRSSASYLATQLRPDVDPILRILRPYRTPAFQFLFFSKGAKQYKVLAKTGKHAWFEDELYPYQTTVVSTFTAPGAVTGTIILTNPEYLQANSVILLEDTGTMAYLTAAPTGTSCPISSLDATTLLGGASAGSKVKIFITQANEYGGVPVSRSTQAVEKYNYCTIMAESVSTTGRDESGQAWTDGETHDEQVQKKIEEMKFTFERMNMLANNSPIARQLSVGGVTYLWTMGEGLVHRITTNKIPYTKGAMTEGQWNKYITQVTEKGSDFRIHYAGTQQILDINAWIGAKVHLVENVTHEYGVAAKRLYAPTGVAIDIVHAPVLDGVYTNYGITIDPECYSLLYQADDKKGSRKYRIEPNVELPGQDGTTTKILMDVGTKLTNEEQCGILYGEGVTE